MMSDETVVVGGPGSAPKQRLGKYVLEGVLGEGAMGVVYRARDPALDRDVAIKTIRASGFPAEVLAELRMRFQREAKSAARLSHPGIVQIYDCCDAGGVAYLVMEFVDGRSLKETLAAGERLPVDAAVRLGADVLDALEHAHEHGVVHRDIKPANVMLGRDGVAKLTDFGIARLDVEGLTVTQAGQIIGTPGYMAPEQVQGHPATKSTDIYAAGVMIYELVTGEKPFTGSTTSLLHRIVHDEPIPPTVINVSAPSWLDAVLLKAMAKRPDQRYPTARAFAQALRDAGREQTRRPAKGRLAVAGLAAALLAAGGGSAWLYRDMLFDPADPVPPVAQAQTPVDPTPTAPAQDGANDQAAWEQAQATASIEAYEAYLRSFPGGEYAAAARAAIETLQDAAAVDLAWSQTEAADTRTAYETFLADHPQAEQAAVARQRIVDLAQRPVGSEQSAWDQAQAADTADAYRAFVDAYPQSGRAVDAEARIAAIEADERAWAIAVADGGFAAFQAYAEQFPDGRHRAEAEAATLGFYRQAADAQAWQQAVERDTVDDYRDYLATFADGDSVAEAEARLRVLEGQAAEEAAWSDAEAAYSIAGYEAFLNAFPDSTRVDLAAGRIAEIERRQDEDQARAVAEADERAWAAAQADGSFAAIQTYAEQFPNGLYRAEAEAATLAFYRQAADAQAWRQAVDRDTADAYRDYLAAFADGESAAEAEARLQVLESRAAGPDVPPTDAGESPQAAIEAGLNLDRDDRRVVQRGLNALGFSAGAPDGILGDNSREAIQAFQRDRGELATGYLNQAQWWVLRDAAAAVERDRVETTAAPAAPVLPAPPPLSIDFGLVARLNGPWADADTGGCVPTLIFSLVNQGGSVRWQGAYGVQSAAVTVEAAAIGIVTLDMDGIGPVDVRVTSTGVTFLGQAYRRC